MKRMSVARVAGRLVTVFLVLALLLSALPVSVLASSPLPERLHPLLAKMADEHPNEMVRVIVIGNNSGGRLGVAVEAAGAVGKKAVPIVKGYAARMPAARARALAKHPDVNWVSPDARVLPMGTTIDASLLAVDYPLAVKAQSVWNGIPSYLGTNVGVALVDTGITPSADLDGGQRVLGNATFSSGASSASDGFGHGTHLAGIIASNGKGSGGKYVGIAPGANLINVKVSDDQGVTYVSDVLEGLQWVLRNRAAYNVRVVNLSLVSTVAESYLTSPLSAAVELLWLSGIAVVVSAGNLGPDSALYPPANDPLVITVGAVDTNGTGGNGDDTIPSWSSYGATQDGFSKPEVVAPGRRIISNLASADGLLARQLPDRIVDGKYFRLSGTSMSAAVVSGVAALALQAHPNWTPDQVKSALMSAARPVPGAGAGSGQVDARGVVSVLLPGFANLGVPLNLGVAQVAGVATFNSATWNSATWNSATWNSATWNSATWNSATWNSATWNSATWNSATWNSATWNSATWNSATWNSVLAD